MKIFPDAEMENHNRFQGRSVTSDFRVLNELVEQFARSQPDKIAVNHNGKNLSYAELVNDSKIFSKQLRHLGMNKGDRVAVFMEPSAWTLVAVLGIHRFGAVYVPVDPSFPAERINAILAEIQPKLIVANTDTNAISEQFNTAVRPIAEMIVDSDIDEEELVIDPEAISHIFFTSGTTGRPKGVVSTHRNLAHYLDSAVSHYQFTAADRFVAAARFTFSISLFELLVPLAVGASVEILPRSSVLDMKSLAAAVERATVFHFGPSLLKKLLPFIRENYPSFAPFANLHHVSSGGDLIPPEILEGMKEIFSNAEVFVIYGCSEISCMGCTYPVPRHQHIAKTKVGKPMQNMEVRILDEHGNHAPRGIAGHVHFSGAGLVKEYLGQPVLTAQKFHSLDGIRFYDTGDIGRIDNEGNLELLGRDDFQVKIRGIRIEIQEIEQALKQHPLISDCVVVARAVNSDERSLVAYLVTTSKAIGSADLIEYLSGKIPDYMVPSIYVALEALPLNHNGKLDRSQLPAPDKDNILLSADFQQAEDDVEAFLIAMWERIFSFDGIGIDHNFFEVGGDSLSAVQILTEIEKKYQRLLSFGDFLDDPTIRKLAQKIREKLARPPEETQSIVLFRKGADDKPPIFLLDAVLLYKDLAKALDCDRTVYALYLPEDAQQVKDVIYQHRQRFAAIITSYVAQIRALQPNGPYIICGHSFGGLIALEVARQLQSEGETIQLLALIDTWCPGFRYNMGPLLRVAEHLRLAFTHGWSYVSERLKRSFEKVRKTFSAAHQPAIPDNREEIDLRWLVVTLMDGKTFIPARYDEPVLLFKAKTRGEFQPPCPYLGWKDTLTSVSVHAIAGNHYGMLETGNVEQMAQVIMQNINTKSCANGV
ncbi:MAG: amino acid adenylation domain-containing protein [Spongiibacteraceae bacterium]